MATFHLPDYLVRGLARAMGPCGWADFHGASPGCARRCIRGRAASEDLVRRGRFRTGASAVKGISLYLFLSGRLPSADVRFWSATEAKNEETSSTEK
jgi:hypothetical protein